MAGSREKVRDKGATPRGRRSSDATTITDILQSAKSEFAKSGFDGATVDTICRRAKVSKQLLYYYFGSKAELYSLILGEAALGTQDIVKNNDFCSLEPEDALSRFIETMFHHYIERPQIVKMTIDEAQHDFVHVGKKSALCAVLRGLIDGVLLDIIERGQRKGCFREGIDADDLFWVIYSLVTTWFAHSTLVSIVSQKRDGKDIGAHHWRSSSIDFILASVSTRNC